MALENNFCLMKVNDSNQKARYIDILLIEKSKAWFHVVYFSNT